MSITIKCLWCGEHMTAEHQNKKVCSDSCRKALSRWRDKLHIQNTTAFIYLEGIERFNGDHPNPEYRKESYAQLLHHS